MMSKRDEILDVAESLFNQSGYGGVGVDLIRDTAGVSKTSMYRHFGSKSKLTEAVLERRHRRFEEVLDRLIAADVSVEHRLDALLDWHFTWFRQPDFNGCMFMHAWAEFKNSDDALAQVAAEHKRWLQSLIARALGDDVQQALKTEAIMTFLEGMMIRAEFDKASGNEAVYRAGVKALAGLVQP